MKKNELQPGTEVIASLEYGDEYAYDNKGPQVVRYRLNDYDDNTLVGVVTSKAAGAGKVYVQWSNGFRKVGGEDGEEVDVKVLSLVSDRFELEKDFKAAQKQVLAKMREAANLVKEAGKMAEKAGLPPLVNMYDVSRPLVDAMDNNGWRSSSWGC